MKNRSRNKLLVALGLGLLGSYALADQRVESGQFTASVVELYTSEGCSSCPPADRFLSGLGETQQSDQVIPLAFHVDYWDYIGWKDPYASAEFTRRQREAARANQQATVYTPEFVVDGIEARGGNAIVSSITSTQATPARAGITLVLSALEGKRLSAEVHISRLEYSGQKKPVVYLALFENALSSAIDAGENSGRTLRHDYVVRYLTPLQPAVAGETNRFELALQPGWEQSNLGVAAIVSLSESGQTLQAVRTMLAAPGEPG